MHDGYPWQARIGRCADLDDDEWVGAGVLIGPRQVMTCATVVAAALRAEVGTAAPAGEIAVILPLLPNPHRGIARVAAWAPYAGLDPRWTLPGAQPPGLAVLELTEPVPQLAVAAELELLEPAAYRNRAVFCLGFPPEHPTGLRIHADCADEDAQTITGLETDHGSIDGSFTGTGAWDPIRESVLGLVVAADSPGRNGFLLPSQALIAVWPQARIRQDQGVGARLLTWIAGLDTRLGNRLLRLGAGLAFAALGLVWWLEPDTPAPLPPAEPIAATSGIAGFVWERSGQPIPGVRVFIPTRAASSETDRFGRFIITLREPAGARIEVMVIAPGYRSQSSLHRIGDNRINLVLEPNQGDDRPVD